MLKVNRREFLRRSAQSAAGSGLISPKVNRRLWRRELKRLSRSMCRPGGTR